MTTPNPPFWAAQVWFDQGKLHLHLPATQGLTSHRLTFPCDMQGLIRLKGLLEQRSHLSLIGTEGDLTQWQVDKKLKTKVDTKGVPITKTKVKDKFVPELRAAARSVLRGLGLIGAVSR
jgi:hypothetical protein